MFNRYLTDTYRYLHVPQLQHLGFENLKKYLKEVSTYFTWSD